MLVNKSELNKESMWSFPDIPYYKNEEIKDKINELLLENAKIEATLGKDSTKKEWAKAKVKQDKIFSKIKELDSEFYDIIQPGDDRS